MGGGEGVRASRDGDRFHYYWAARRALHLLDPTGTLRAIAVEGLPEGESVDGDEVIDVAEYHDGIDAATSSTSCYTQLKHSTLRVDEPIVASDLQGTLMRFAKIYRGQADTGGTDTLQFAFVANRRLNDKVRASLDELADGTEAFTHRTEAALLRRYLGFGEDRRAELAFCRRFSVDDRSPGLAEIEDLVRDELHQYLPGGTGTEMTQLVEAVARCATSLADRQTLYRSDVLLALRVTAEELFPAPSSIEQLNHAIRTHDVDRVADELTIGRSTKLLITAVGGVGKSVLTTLLPQVLPAGSAMVVYDCFAGGDYRKITSQRHDHRTALTQISNELAAGGWCLPLIPTQTQDSAYVRVFMQRIRTAAGQLGLAHPTALLTVVVDAADNAATAAAEQRCRTFVTDLFREDWPPNARLIQLCRPERVHLLEVPRAGVTTLGLEGFDKTESLGHLRTRFPDATAEEGAEFHALSGGNPRVQAMAMENAGSVGEALSAIRIARNAPGEVLDGLLLGQVQAVVDEGQLRPDELARLCESLAVFHPSIPLDDLATVSGLDADAIRSFAVALGRGLHLTGTAVQFRDEPTETWFRRTYTPDVAGLRRLVETVRPHASESPYLASSLPQLLFEAEMLDELVALALSDAALPIGANDAQAHAIARSRARFALGATLRVGRHADAARLAVRNGALLSGHSRRIALIRTHTDLAARFLGAGVVEELCSGRELATDWPGSNLHVEAALLSHIGQFADLARGRLRSAYDNIGALLRMPDDEQQELRASITATEIADLAMAATNVGGPDGAARFLARWKPDEVVHEVAVKLTGRLADAGRESDLAGLVLACDDLPGVQMAVARTMFDYDFVPAPDVATTLVTGLLALEHPFPWAQGARVPSTDVRDVVWVLIHGLRVGCITGEEAARTLDHRLPQHLPDSIGQRIHGTTPTDQLLGHALRARLRGSDLLLQNVTSEGLLALMNPDYVADGNARSFKANIPGLLPWATCWLRAVLDGFSADVAIEVEALVDADLTPVASYETPYVRVNGIAEMAVRILGLAARADLMTKYADWHEGSHTALTRSRLIVTRIAARSPHLESFVLAAVTRGVAIVQLDRTDAETRIESLIELARTLLAVNEAEALAMFTLAVEEADLVGDDLHTRWCALTNTASVLRSGSEPARAYRLFQVAEALDRNGEIDTRLVGQRLHDLHEPTYLAAASRARDRRTLDLRGMLTAAFTAVLHSSPEQLDLLALIAFRPFSRWDSIATKLSPSARAAVSSVLKEFSRFERNRDDSPQRAYTTTVWGDEDEKDPTDRVDRYSDADLITEDGWNDALVLVGWREEDRRALVDFAMAANPGRRPQVLDALARAARACEADFEALAVAAASAQPQTPALIRARKQLGTAMAVRFARRIGTRYDDTRLTVVADLTGHTVATMSRIAFTELGREAHLLTYRDSFLLASHLATVAGADAAGRVFDDLSELFEDLAPSATSSDGNFHFVPSPPADHATGVAGLIWTALGDMAIATRWQAAHAVLLLVRLGCRTEVYALLRFADGTSRPTAFHDARLPLYSLHARTWLLLVIARAASESSAATLSCFAPWLVGVVRGPRHAANQVLAQRALRDLVARGHITLDAADADVLTQPVVAATTVLDYRQQRARPDPLEFGPGDEPGRYPFFLDFEKYWCGGVADAFGSSDEHVARRAVEVARELDASGFFVSGEDPRVDAGVYDTQRSYPSHGAWPEQESHEFYLAVHALLTVGAELAAVVPAHRYPDSPTDSYSEWLARFLPKRPDGRWLSDRRDPSPSPAPERVLTLHGPKTTWPWTVTRHDFDISAGAGEEWVTVGADTRAAHDYLSYDTLIESALVPHESARSLLVAAQTAPVGPGTFNLSALTDDDYGRPAAHPFTITPWLEHSKYHEGIDVHDERAGGVEFPPVRPDDDIVTRFGLVPDADQRLWFRDGIAVFRSNVWGDLATSRSDHETGTRGDRLDVHRQFLREMLHALDRTLIIHVRLRRDHRRPYYARQEKKDDEFRWLEWSGKVYLVDPGGRWFDY